jgi:hypothetical protein
MREYVRWWITEWDLKRLFPEYEPDIEVRRVVLDYTEDAELETSAEGDPEAIDPEAPPRAAEW